MIPEKDKKYYIECWADDPILEENLLIFKGIGTFTGETSIDRYKETLYVFKFPEDENILATLFGNEDIVKEVPQ